MIRLAFAIVAFVCLPLAVLAADSSSGVDITQFVVPLVLAIVGGVMSFLLWLVKAWVQKRYGLALSDSDSAALDAALRNGANSFINQALMKGGPITVDTKSLAVNAALSYAAAHEPDAMARLKAAGLDPDTLAQKAESRVATALNLATPIPNLEVKP